MGKKIKRKGLSGYGFINTIFQDLVLDRRRLFAQPCEAAACWHAGVDGQVLPAVRQLLLVVDAVIDYHRNGHVAIGVCRLDSFILSVL